MMPLRRFFKKTPAFDCVSNPCGKNGCGEDFQRNHGRGVELWTYALSTGSVAIELVVGTPYHVHYTPQDFEGRWLFGHAAWRVADTDVRKAAEPKRCEYLSEGICFDTGTTSALEAEELFKAHGRGQEEQTEAFWSALELKLGEWERAALLVQHRRRCPVCDGSGIITSHAGGGS